MSTTPNMNLVVPEVLVTSGPQYATQINASLDVVDAHDHSSGKGVRVTPSGLNINVDLPFNSNQATGLKGVVLTDQDAVTYLTNAAVFRSGADLYYRDGNGVAIRITASGAINTASVGAITALASPAAATYVAASKKFVWLSTGTEYATMEAGDLKVISTASGATQAVTIKADVATSAYDLRLPDLGPTDNQIMRMKASSAGTFVSLLGTTNQVTVTHNSGDITLALPQNIHTAATPTFAGLNAAVGAFSGQVDVGSLVSAGSVSGTTATFSDNVVLSGGLTKTLLATNITATFNVVNANTIKPVGVQLLCDGNLGVNGTMAATATDVATMTTNALVEKTAGAGITMVGRTNGSAYSIGQIGYVTSYTLGSNQTFSAGPFNHYDLIPFLVPAGEWDLEATVLFQIDPSSVGLGNQDVKITHVKAGISSASGSFDSNVQTNSMVMPYTAILGGSEIFAVATPVRRVRVSTSTTYYLAVSMTQGVGAPVNGSRFLGTSAIKLARVG